MKLDFSHSTHERTCSLRERSLQIRIIDWKTQQDRAPTCWSLFPALFIIPECIVQMLFMISVITSSSSQLQKWVWWLIIEKWAAVALVWSPEWWAVHWDLWLQVFRGFQLVSASSVCLPVCIGEHVAERIAFRNLLYNCFKSGSGVLC